MADDKTMIAAQRNRSAVTEEALDGIRANGQYGHTPFRISMTRSRPMLNATWCATTMLSETP